ncbi:MAG: O-antigen ligase family protein [Thiotrichaceae bacterium]|nr:O-antigen ligase family protein [Thiotrichaceae bacterium]
MIAKITSYILFSFAVVLLLLYPIAGGVQRLLVNPYAYALGLAILFIYFLTQSKYDHLSRGTWWLLLLIIVTPLVYLIPISLSWWQSLPGHDVYSQVNQWLFQNYNIEPEYYSLSLIPYQTEYSFYALFPPLALFMVMASFKQNMQHWMLYVFVAIAGGEACLAVIQFGSQNEYFFFGIPRLKDSMALGTYPNPDHFSLLMAIAIPFVMVLLFKQLGGKKKRSKRRRRSKSSRRILYIMAYSTLIILLFMSAIFSGSRAGIALAFIAIFLSYKRFTHRKKFSYMLLVVILAVGLGILMMVLDIAPIINRFLKENPFVDGRWTIFSNSWEGIQSFFPLGSGPGTFPYVYKIFQPIEQAGFINHAHNDYIELIFETGIIGVIGLISFFILFITRWRILAAETHSGVRFKQAAGISLVIILLHSILEFNMHDSFNILFFALLSGFFFAQRGGESSRLKIDMGCLSK